MRKKIIDICQVQPGIHVKSSGFEKDGNFIFLKLNDVPLENIEMHDFTKTNYEVDEKFILRADDVLFSTRIKFNAYRIQSTQTNRYIASSSFVILRPDQHQILSDYLSWYLNLPLVTEYIQGLNASGTNMPFLSNKRLKELEIDVPSVTIQEQIVAIYKLQLREKYLTEKILSLRQFYTQNILLNKAQQ